MLGAVCFEMPAPRQTTPTKNKSLSAVAAQALKRSADPARTFESPQEKRKSKKGSDVPPEVRKAAVSEYRAVLAGRAKLGRGEGKALEAKFHRYGIKLRSIQHWNQTLREAEATEEDPVKARLSLESRRVGRAPTNTKLTVEIAESIISINARSWGKLSVKKLAGRVLLKHPELGTIPPETMRRWCSVLGAKRHRQYIKPHLKPQHKLQRLAWVLDNELDGNTLSDHKDTVHIDEKWFFLMHDGEVCRCFPDANGEYVLPPPRKVHHKSRMPKLMFLAAVARPRPEYNFDGKIGIWYFANVRKAQRSHASTGTVKGVTDILEAYSVTADVYCDLVVGKGGIMEAVREKMWWYKKGSGKPEAGKTIWIQQDGARPHTAKANQKRFNAHKKKFDFHLEMCTQPPQSPDLNVDDLGFFNSLQSDTKCVAMKDLFELRTAVNQCFKDYPTASLERCWRCLTISMHGILESGGDNVYQTHRGDRRRASADLEEVRVVAADVIKKAKRRRDELQREWDRLGTRGAAESSDDESEGD